MKKVCSVAIGTLVGISLLVSGCDTTSTESRQISAREAYNIVLPHAQNIMPGSILQEVRMQGTRDCAGKSTTWELRFCSPDTGNYVWLDTTAEGVEIDHEGERELQYCTPLNEGWVDSTVAWQAIDWQEVDCYDKLRWGYLDPSSQGDEWTFAWCSWGDYDPDHKYAGTFREYIIDAADGHLIKDIIGSCWE